MFFERVHMSIPTSFCFLHFPCFDLGKIVNIFSQICYASDVDEQFKLLVESGLSVREVAERTGLSKSTVGRKRKGLGDA